MDTNLSAYLAGVWDSDGSISVSIVHKKRPNPSYIVSLQLTWVKTDKTFNVFNILKQKYGGNVCECEFKKGRFLNASPIIKYNIVCRQSKKLLEDMLPFLQLKKEQAQLALEVINTTELGKYGNKRPKPKELMDRHYNIYIEMKKLNTKNSGDRRAN